MIHLSDKKCLACEGDVPSLTTDQAAEFLHHVDNGWRIVEGKKIIREFLFENFNKTMQFVNKVADIAEEEGHHPDMHVSYSKLVIELWTHAIGGLSENDFILAAKIDTLKS